jgi:DNA-binding NarL/FixJ family response regulator
MQAESGKIKVLVVDDHNILRVGILSLLAEADDIEVVGEATDGQEALEKLSILQVDVILLDLVMPRLDGIQVIQELKRMRPPCPCPCAFKL